MPTNRETVQGTACTRQDIGKPSMKQDVALTRQIVLSQEAEP